MRVSGRQSKTASLVIQSLGLSPEITTALQGLRCPSRAGSLYDFVAFYDHLLSSFVAHFFPYKSRNFLQAICIVFLFFINSKVKTAVILFFLVFFNHGLHDSNRIIANVTAHGTDTDVVLSNYQSLSNETLFIHPITRKLSQIFYLGNIPS